MPFLRTRTIPVVPVAGGTVRVVLLPGMVADGVVLSTLYATTLTVAGAAVRQRSGPVRRISLDADGTILQVWRARDLIAITQIMEQTPLAGLITAASAFGIATYSNLEAHYPLKFSQMRSENGDKTALPMWAYKEIALIIEFGDVTDLFTGTPTGTIAFTAGGTTITQQEFADLPIASPTAFALSLPRTVARYIETAVSGVVGDDVEMADVGTSAQVRALLMCTEGSNAEPTNVIAGNVTVKENRTNPLYENYPWATIRAENARTFGVTMPPGYALIDFAADGDIDKIYDARKKSVVKLLADTLVSAGTFRTIPITIEPPLRAAARAQ